MVRARLGRIAGNVLMVAMLATAAPAGAEAQGAADVAALNKQVVQLYGQGKYKEAATIAEKALALAERVLGRERPDTLRRNRLGAPHPLTKSPASDRRPGQARHVLVAA